MLAGYGYNGDGLRMSQTSAAGTQQFTWDTSQQVPQVLADGSNDYIYGPDGLPIEQISGTGTASYFLHDSNGNTRALLNGGGGVGATFGYTPYGALSSRTGTLTTPLLYGQGYTDAATGLVYLVNRYYDPATGQFLTVDPAVDQTQQPYVYTDDDPLNSSDPTGLLDGGDPFGFIVTAVDTVKAAYSTARAPVVCIFGSSCRKAVDQAGRNDKQAAEDYLQDTFLKFPTLILPKLNLPGWPGYSPSTKNLSDISLPEMRFASVSYITAHISYISYASVISCG